MIYLDRARMIVIKVFDNTVDVLLTCVKHLHYRIISLKGDVCVHRTSLSYFFLNVYFKPGNGVVTYMWVRGI